MLYDKAEQFIYILSNTDFKYHKESKQNTLVIQPSKASRPTFETGKLNSSKKKENKNYHHDITIKAKCRFFVSTMSYKKYQVRLWY